MKTREELEPMTKADLDEYAKSELGAELDRRKAKATLIEEVIALQAGATPDPGADPDAQGDSDENPKGTPKAVPKAPKGQVTLTITRFPSTSGVPLYINGKHFDLPIGKPVTVPASILPTLAKIKGLEFTKE